MKILITGGLGYIGSSLAEHLNKYHNITVCSRSPKACNTGVTTINSQVVDWKNKNTLDELCNKKDVIIHAAGMNSHDCVKNPKKAIECNHLNTKKIVTAAINNRVNTFIYISTAHVYCSPLQGLINEETLISNNHPYASSHRLGELEIIRLTKNTKTKPLIIRLSNAYGIPINDNIDAWKLIINNFCMKAYHDLNIQLDSDGLEKRDFISLDEVNKAITFLLHNQDHNSEVIYNLGTGDSYSIIEIANIIKDIMLKKYNKKINIFTNQKNKKEIEFFKYDITKLLSEGFIPKTNIRKNIEEILDFFTNDT